MEDLLWLARFDSQPPAPHAELVDPVTAARQCADRFASVLQARNVVLHIEAHADEVAMISAAPDWVDRLRGVLVDNAIRYATPPGRVLVRVTNDGGHIRLTVADNGPGIPRAEPGCSTGFTASPTPGKAPDSDWPSPT